MKQRSSRRSFLAGLAGGAALWPSALSALGRRTSAAPDEEAYWKRVREQFPFSEDRVPMNAGNLCPSPRVVADRLFSLTRNINGDVSYTNRAKFSGLKEEARGKVAAHLGVHSDEIALVRNTSEANSTVIQGLPLSAGDEVLLWDQNHPTNNVAWDVLAARFDLSIKRVTTPAQPDGADELSAIFDAAIGPRTRVLALTHVSNTSGIRLPVADIAARAHQRDIFVLVDGAQSWGALNVDLPELACDAFSASTHKWFCGPKEAGVLYVKRDHIERIWPHTVAFAWGESVETVQKGARKFESLGQRDDACLAAVGTAADFHQSLGPDRVEARVLELAKRLKSGLREAGLPLVTPLEAQLSAGVCLVEVAQQKRRELVQRLDELGIAGSPAGGLRLCPHVYNTEAHIDRAIAAVASLRAFVNG